MQVDVLVIGGGIAGTIAAAAAADLGASVVLIRRGLGATAMSTGCIDLAPDLLARPGEAALVARGLADRSTVASHIDRLLDHRPLHPYSVLGLRRSQVSAAATFLQESLGAEALEWRGEDRPPFILANAAGAIRAADLCPPAAAAGDLRGLEGTRVAVADFGPALPIWEAKGLAKTLRDQTGRVDGFTAIAVPAPPELERGAPDHLHLAMALEADGGEAFAAAAGEALRGEGFSHLLLPPACGIHRWPDILHHIRQATSLIPFEVLPATPPSIPGLRLQQALDGVAERAGVSMREGLCEGFDASYGRIVRVHVAAGDPLLRFVEPESVVLATGRFLGGGIRWERRPAESVFGLPVRVGERYPRDAPPARHMRPDAMEHQPVFASGVTFGDDLRPLAPGGRVAYSNLFAAGSVLAGHDDGAARGGAGAGLVTGWVAGRAAARASRVAEGRSATPKPAGSGERQNGGPV